jgi:hypothetical protein
MSKPTAKRDYGMATFYLRDKNNKQNYELFSKLLEYDDNFSKLRFKKGYGLKSIALNQFIQSYIDAAENGEIDGITESIIKTIKNQIKFEENIGEEIHVKTPT